MSPNSQMAAALVTPAAAQPVMEYSPSLEEAELLQLSHEWMDVALNVKDERRLREIMAPEFTLQIWDGSRAPQSLDTWMHTTLRRLEKIVFTYAGLNARVFGDAAIVYSRFSWSGILDGQTFTDRGFIADFWERRTGRWQVVSRRSAPLQQIRELTEAPLPPAGFATKPVPGRLAVEGGHPYNKLGRNNYE